VDQLQHDEGIRKSRAYQTAYEEAMRESEVRGFDGSGGSSFQEPEGHTAWPEPEDLPGGLSPVPAMSEKMIPEPLRSWLIDIADRMQCPLDFPVIGSLVALASLVGRRVGMKTLRRLASHPESMGSCHRTAGHYEESCPR